MAYHCRGCGGRLPEGTSAHFHPECLRIDKQRRVAEKRRLEAERRRAWLCRQHCPDCGASLQKLAGVSPGEVAETKCEASQDTQVNAISSGNGEGQEATAELSRVDAGTSDANGGRAVQQRLLKERRSQYARPIPQGDRG